MPEDRPSTIVMLVANAVVGDSRVLKSARSAMDAGHDVVVVGLASRRYASGQLDVDGVRVVRLRPSFALHNKLRKGTDLEELRPQVRHAQRRAVGFDLRATAGRGRRPHARADRWHARARQLGGLAWWHLRGGGPVPAFARRAGAAALSGVVGAQGRRGWATAWPLFVDYEVELTSVVLDLEPDLIHAHDVHLSHVASRVSGIMAAAGRRVPWIYDAHEWIPGVPMPERRMRLGTDALERDQIIRADAVLTVSDVLAERLVDRYGLTDRPVVVHNAPSTHSVPAPDRQPLRAELGLADDVPLLVYAGAAAERRGLRDVVDAMPSLPDTHVALIVDLASRFVAELALRAAELGVEDRLHVRPYVPPSSVSWYLASADAGLAPFHRTSSHDVALATKVREYLHAGLPLIASDCTAMAQYVAETGVGKVFTAQDVTGLAAAARGVLVDADEHRARITPELLDENSWEREEKVLQALYSRLLAG